MEIEIVFLSYLYALSTRVDRALAECGSDHSFVTTNNHPHQMILHKLIVVINKLEM